MQSKQELYDKIKGERPALPDETINEWIQYLVQLKGCRLFSTTAQDLDEEAWLEARTAGIGGSEIAAIIGKNPWNSARQIWLKKTGQFADKEVKQSEAARWGNLLETIVATEWGHRNERQWVSIPVILQSEEYPWMLANVDGFTLTDDRSEITGVLEIKTTTEYNKAAWEYGPIPEYYVCQTNWYCMITGQTNYTIVALVGGQTLFSYDLVADPYLQAEMKEAANVFWLENVQKLNEPVAQAGDLDTLKELPVDDEVEPVIMDDDETETLVDSYVLVREKISALDKVKKALYAQIFDAIGTAPQVLTQTRTVTLQQSNRRSCDYELLQAKYPDAYEETIRMTLSRSLRIK